VRRFDPDTVHNGDINSSIKEKEIFIYRVYFDIFLLVRLSYGRDEPCGLKQCVS